MRDSDPVVIDVSVTKTRTPPLDRILRNVSYDHGCWTLRRMVNAIGYGLVGIPGAGTKLAHRFTYQELVGEIPPGHDLDHLCRNRACVNPLHLEPVTRRENARRGAMQGSKASEARRAVLARGRALGPLASGAKRRAQTHCKRGHEFTPENTSVLATGSRMCITCNRARAKAHKQGRKLDG